MILRFRVFGLESSCMVRAYDQMRCTPLLYHARSSVYFPIARVVIRMVGQLHGTDMHKSTVKTTPNLERKSRRSRFPFLHPEPGP